MNLNIDTFIGILGIFIGVGLWYFDIHKKLRQILSQHEGILNHEQADDLTEMYLLIVNAKLTASLFEYADNHFITEYENSNIEGIMLEFRRRYKEVVNDSAMTMVRRFRVRGNYSFDTIVAAVDHKRIEDAFIKLEVRLGESVRKQLPAKIVLSAAAMSIGRLGDEGKRLIRAKLKKLYPITIEFPASRLTED